MTSLDCLIPFRRRALHPSAVAAARRPADLFDRMVGDFLGDGWLAAQGRGEESAWLPALDLSEDDKSYTVRAELPGVDAKDVEVELHDGVLVLSGKKESRASGSSHGEKGDGVTWSERRFGSFRRVVELPTAVQQESVAAHCEKGVLTITLQKATPSTGRKIPVAAR